MGSGCLGEVIEKSKMREIKGCATSFMRLGAFRGYCVVGVCTMIVKPRLRVLILITSFYGIRLIMLFE